MREWSTLRKLMLLKGATGAPLNEYTSTGNPLTFNTNKAKPLRSVLASWQPHQSGSGDPSPENVRPVLGMDGVNVWQTGKNLLDKTQFTDDKVWWQGKPESGYTNNCVSPKIPVVPGATYIRQGDTASQNYVSYFDRNGDYVTQDAWAAGYTKTIPSGVYYAGFSFAKAHKDEAMLSVGNSASEYEPFVSLDSYSIAFPVVGRNLLASETLYQAGNQYFIGGSSTEYPVHLTEGTYTLSHSGLGAYAYYKKNGGNGTLIHGSNVNYGSFTVAEEGDYQLWFYQPNASADDFYNIMLNSGSSALPYEPYTTTVYGGTLDLTTGVLTAEWAMFSARWGNVRSSTPNPQTGLYETDYYYPNPVKDAIASSAYGVSALSNICNKVQWEGASVSGNHFYIRNSHLFAFMADVSDDEVIQFLAKLTEPIVLATLSPTQISALIGNNTMWADADDLSVTFLKKG